MGRSGQTDRRPPVSVQPRLAMQRPGARTRNVHDRDRSTPSFVLNMACCSPPWGSSYRDGPISRESSEPTRQYHILATPASGTRRDSSDSGADRLHRLEGVDLLEVGDEMRLFILFDRAPALGEPPLLEFGPGPATDPHNAGWAESAGVLSVRIFAVLTPELLLDGRGEPLGGVGAVQVIVLDQQRVIRRLGPGRQQEIRPSAPTGPALAPTQVPG